uniref:BrnA antitoxin of type II toxin-antitoxin system n=1 Tax=Candidatus Kentrum eta TaxID=2126337 RepID=A0A450UV19_9GAMM|nr:MAG: BrnA antitoxin of type II toxin-antitoxin system [Candidatus Kentron sp. H]VFJ96335.1 MAG: BrnA antitoxin of type II toxin-antitoxin system [Candidatus Kentron sp. H]VFK02225.1 MAG: BrnA antitoxin of type II toxin-antitoxin system [Candidatus Kentron sp. H]
MNNVSSSPISHERDEYPEITQADLDRAIFRVGFRPAPRRQRITLSLESNLVDYFKSKAGERGYRTLMSETLRQAKEREEFKNTTATMGHP